MANREFRDRLKRRAKAAGIYSDAPLVEKLETYYQLLTKWNAKINLTAFRLVPDGEESAIDRLLIEPVVAARYVPENARTLLDAGSGGGSPAIPLKLASHEPAPADGRSQNAQGRVPARGRSRARACATRKLKRRDSRSCFRAPELHEALDLVSIRAVRVETRTLLTLQAFLKPGGKLLLFRAPGRAISKTRRHRR